MPQVSIVDAAAPERGAVVVGTLAGADGARLAPGAEPIDAALHGRLAAALRAAGATGKPDDVVKIPTLGLAPFDLVVASGLGAEAAAEPARRAVGAALRALPRATDVHVALAAPVDALAEGGLLGGYAFGAYKSGGKPPALRRLTIAGAADRAARAALRRARIVADAVIVTRDLVNTPANDLYPETFAQRARELGAEHDLDVEVLDERALRRGGYGGLLAVGGGSARPPRLVRVAYRPARPRTRIALVGKGITFDSGGLNLKRDPSMGWMKADMGGAAAALATVVAAARLRLPVELVATLPLAENMISGSAYRPSDVVAVRGGRTLEIADTDAEGRVVLVDAMARAVEDDPAALIEVSTLTGGQVVALGLRVVGVMGEAGLRDEVVAAGRAAGEALWAMPLPEELRAGLDSPVADIATLPGDRWASMLVAGRFLSDFVPDGLPWVHLDIAGPSFNPGAAHGYTPKGGTGVPVRTLVATLERLAATHPR